MFAQLALITAAAFLASVIHGDNDAVYKKEMCQTPNFTNWKDCNGTDTGYYFNHTKGLCLKLTDTGCVNQTLYSSRKACATGCNSTEGARHCARGPTSPCNSTSEKGRRRYFYNITTNACSPYQRCQNVHPSDGENSFYTIRSCKNECQGFTVEDIKRE
nr:uncharacterized protein LOC129385781 [Dermacentor andersoni]XP_054928863.1 uncharacterized protein LOC129385781 [Dermacentor andersoni]XP_054928864.1 uncharacterized protein LOC129385781 [Dermacentor andersoni]XP_054928865.1 uncharacterized protein LOC129385781 [Dermacentor andersoni]XP_054928866.1 uncharacterized protein LOC129385781 [Dermacentor andersoni]XP_054928867.1 uncharacterized protein LOC129385781 [Dermacentor andersoni]XP_054928868.1 uncharacterized protein LOC129385781 [Dermac